jgi:hypothetical protein
MEEKELSNLDKVLVVLLGIPLAALLLGVMVYIPAAVSSNISASLLGRAPLDFKDSMIVAFHVSAIMVTWKLLFKAISQRIDKKIGELETKQALDKAVDKK